VWLRSCVCGPAAGGQGRLWLSPGLALAPAPGDLGQGRLSASLRDAHPQRSGLGTAYLYGKEGFCNKRLCALHSLGVLPEK